MSGKILYEGKTKIILEGRDDKTCIIKYKDTATAFNGIKKEEFAGKGELNNAISNIIYEYLKNNGIKTHLLEVIDATSVLAKKAEIIMVEVIIRNIAAGGFSKKYGVLEGTKLENTVLEFCLKADALDDPMMNETQITAISLATADELKVMSDMAYKINDLLIAFFEKAGIKLVDFKLEFGRCDGEIILCDEISPDSCRLWDIKTNEKLDKDRFRRDMGNFMESYKDVFGRIK